MAPASPALLLPAWAAFCREELAPTPERLRATGRLVTASVATLLLCETLRIPEIAFSLYVGFFIVHDNPKLSLKLGLLAVVAAALALAVGLGITLNFLDAPWLRVPLALLVLTGALWLSRVLVLAPIGRLLAVILSLSISLADAIPGAEALARSVLWLWPVASIGVGMAVLMSKLWSPASLPPSRPLPPGLFVADAFANPRHLEFALRTAAAVGACEILINAAAWPGIRTAMVTCVVTSLATAGQTTQKLLLRLVGATLGGLLGLFSTCVLIPSMDSIASLCVLIGAGTAAAAWIAAGSSRISYMGFQIALAFYLTVVQDFSISVDLTAIRDRFVGILLGVFMMALFFLPFAPREEAKAVGQA